MSNENTEEIYIVVVVDVHTARERVVAAYRDYDQAMVAAEQQLDTAFVDTIELE